MSLLVELRSLSDRTHKLSRCSSDLTFLEDLPKFLCAQNCHGEARAHLRCRGSLTIQSAITVNLISLANLAHFSQFWGSVLSVFYQLLLLLLLSLFLSVSVTKRLEGFFLPRWLSFGSNLRLEPSEKSTTTSVMREIADRQCRRFILDLCLLYFFTHHIWKSQRLLAKEYITGSSILR